MIRKMMENMIRNLYDSVKAGLARQPAVRSSSVFAAAVAAMAVGCSPAPPTMDDLGQIVYQPSQVPGFDRPYELPHGLGEEPAEPAEGAQPSAASSSPQSNPSE